MVEIEQLALIFQPLVLINLNFVYGFTLFYFITNFDFHIFRINFVFLKIIVNIKTLYPPQKENEIK